jgi:hypothetical protein
VALKQLQNRESEGQGPRPGGSGVSALVEIACGASGTTGLTTCQDAVRSPETEKEGCKVRANVPINPPQRDLYCANRTSGPCVSGITTTVQITVTASIFGDAMNSNPNLVALNDRNY